MVFGIGGGTGNRRNRQICDAKIRNLLQGEQRLMTSTATNARRKLVALQAQIAGERARCVQEQRRERKNANVKARAIREAGRAEAMQSKAQSMQSRQNMLRQKIETNQARLQLKQQKFEFRQQRVQAGEALSSKTMLQGGLVAAAIAAAMILL
jgi:hypothetical protein